MDQITKTVYCWIKDNKMFFSSSEPPQPNWCDSYIAVEVDTSRDYIFKDLNGTVLVEYK